MGQETNARSYPRVEAFAGFAAVETNDHSFQFADIGPVGHLDFDEKGRGFRGGNSPQCEPIPGNHGWLLGAFQFERVRRPIHFLLLTYHASPNHQSTAVHLSGWPGDQSAQPHAPHAICPGPIWRCSLHCNVPNNRAGHQFLSDRCRDRIRDGVWRRG
jgi:hypothetical protein